MRDMRKVFIGIDPGALGAMAVLDSDVGTRLVLCDYAEYDEELSRYAGRDDVFAVVEDVHAMPMNGCKGNFMLGWSLGRIQQLVEHHGIPHQLVKPQAWQREFGISNKDKSKAQSVAVAKRLFPGEDLRRTPKCTKDHDGSADALLLAEWGRRHG